MVDILRSEFEAVATHGISGHSGLAKGPECTS